MSARQWKPGPFSVVEAINEKRREILVAVALQDFETALPRRPDLLPPEWAADERVELRVVESDLALYEAAEFALTYSESQSLTPYRVYLGGMELPPEPASPAAEDAAAP